MTSCTLFLGSIQDMNTIQSPLRSTNGLFPSDIPQDNPQLQIVCKFKNMTDVSDLQSSGNAANIVCARKIVERRSLIASTKHSCTQYSTIARQRMCPNGFPKCSHFPSVC